MSSALQSNCLYLLISFNKPLLFLWNSLFHSSTLHPWVFLERIFSLMHLEFDYIVGAVLEQVFSYNNLRWVMYNAHDWWTKSITASSLLRFLLIYSKMLKHAHYILLLGSAYLSNCGNWIILLLLWSFLPSQPFSSHTVICFWGPFSAFNICMYI